MSLLTFTLVLVAAVLHATWNLIAKRAASAGAAFVFAYRVSSTVLYAPWVIYVLITETTSWSWMVVGFIFLSSVIHLCYSLCLQRGYQVADLSVVYPIARGTGPLLSSLGAYIWLSEEPSTYGVLGMVCVVGGVLLIATQADWRLFTRPQAWVGVRWGLLIGVFIACYTLTDAYSVKDLRVSPVLLDWLGGLSIVVMMTPRAWVKRDHLVQQMRGKWGLAFAVGAISPLGYILVLYALQHGAQVSLVAPLREMSLMIATLAGFFLLKEKVSPARAIGCVVIIAGVVLLSSR